MKIEDRKRLGLCEKRLIQMESQHRLKVESARHRLIAAKQWQQIQGQSLSRQLEISRKFSGLHSAQRLARAMEQSLDQSEVVRQSDDVVLKCSAALFAAQTAALEVKTRCASVTERIGLIEQSMRSIDDAHVVEDLEALGAGEDPVDGSEKGESADWMTAVIEYAHADSAPIEIESSHQRSTDCQHNLEQHAQPESAFHEEAHTMQRSSPDWEATVRQEPTSVIGGGYTSVQVAVPIGIGRRLSIAVICDRLERVKVLLSTQGEGIPLSSEALRSYLLGQHVNAVEVSLEGEKGGL